MVASVSDPMMAMGRSLLGFRACTAASQAQQISDATAQLFTSGHATRLTLLGHCRKVGSHLLCHVAGGIIPCAGRKPM